MAPFACGGGMVYGVLASNMFASPGYLYDDVLVGTVAALVCVAIGCLVWRRQRKKQREQRREYRERGRQRRQFWGWE